MSTHIVATDASTWNAPARYYDDWDVTISGYPDGGTYKRILVVPPHKAWAASAVLGRMMDVADWLSYPNTLSKKLYVNQELTAKGVGDKCHVSSTGMPVLKNGVLEYRVCAPPYSARLPTVWDPGSPGGPAIQKFQLGHELGHALSLMIGGPGNSFADADTQGMFVPSTADCQCPWNSEHCLQSREYISTAQGESFALFIGTVLFNNREPNGWFTYYKALSAELGGNAPINMNWAGSNSAGHTGPDMWMVRKCAPPAAASGGLGAEIDWVEFFWQIWSASSNSYSIGDMGTVWSNATTFFNWCCRNLTGGPFCYPLPPAQPALTCDAGWETHPFGMKWQNVVNSVGSNISAPGTPKYNLFTDLGRDNGVDL